MLHFYPSNSEPAPAVGPIGPPNAERGGSDGFSVLEALVAMAILAAAMLPLLALQGQFIRSVESFERADTRIAARQNAVAYLKTLNFTQVETGRVVQGDVVLRWTAEPALPTRRTRWPGGEVGRYELTLYNIEAILEFPDASSDRFSVNGLGWRPRWSIADVF